MLNRTTGLLSIFAALMFLLIATPSASAVGKDEGWSRFEEDVTLKHESGEGKFRLRNSEGHFNELRLKPDGASIMLQGVTVIYDDGSHEEFTMKRFIRTGKTSPALRLTSGDRVVKQVLFSYEIKTRDDDAAKTVMTLWTR